MNKYTAGTCHLKQALSNQAWMSSHRENSLFYKM